MSFKIDGEEWTPKTASEHSAELIEKINALLQENNVTDDDGNIVQLSESFANAFYLICLANAAKFQANDEKLTKAINSFNIELCDDQQIENLLPIAAISRNPGSYSTLNLTVTASDSGKAVIPAGTRAPFGDYYFVVDTDHTIEAGTTQIVETTCDTVGAVAVLTGEVTAFETQIANVESVQNNESSVPGVDAETTNELRQRLITGNTIKYTLDGCKSALEELTGVTYARVYFNYNTTTQMTLPGGVILEPRTAYLVIHGANDQIAETYAEYMSAPTQNSPIAEATYSTVELDITAGAAGDATVPAGTSAEYEGFIFQNAEEITVEAGKTVTAEFTCTVTGAVNVPANTITEFTEKITNVDSVINSTAAVPGHDNPAKSQDWITSSGQAITIKYDDATEKNVFVKIVLKSDADSGTQITNQLKRDLIAASSGWGIGQAVTSMNTSSPFVDCTYTDVAYTLVSSDKKTWTNLVEIECNTIPRVSDGSIFVEQLS